MSSYRAWCCLCLAWFGTVALGAEPKVFHVWPGKPPGETRSLPPEEDLYKATDPRIAGRPIIKLGNVSTPQLAVYRPPAASDTTAAVVICPGGGHHILAYDLEGTEVAQWLNTLGITGVVLKYRVPAREPEQRWRAAVQDAQRAVSLVRSHAAEWKLDPARIGILGFSAGGETAALTSILTERQYEAVDEVDRVSSRPDFGLLIYPAALAEKDRPELRKHVTVTAATPPLFFVHAWDDPVSVQNSLLLASALKANGGTAELHIFASGGHGYGLRPTSQAVTRWPALAAPWLEKIISSKSVPD